MVKDLNPYSPPQTEVREPLAPDHAVPRPRQVSWAVWLLWTELALDVLQIVVDVRPTEGNALFLFALGGFVIGLGIEAFVIYKLATRRNWARYVILLFAILNLLDWVGSLRQGLITDPFRGVMTSLELMLDCVALFLVFTSPGKHWFKRV